MQSIPQETVQAWGRLVKAVADHRQADKTIGAVYSSFRENGSLQQAEIFNRQVAAAQRDADQKRRLLAIYATEYVDLIEESAAEEGWEAAWDEGLFA